MRYPILIGTLALAVAGGASAGGEPDYMPLADGNTWYLAELDGGAPLRVTAVKRSQAFVLRNFPGAGDLRVRARGSAVEAWDESADRWEPFLRLGARTGTRYVVDLAGTAWRRVTVTVASRRAVVEDAEGRRRGNCVRLTFRYAKPTPDAGLEELAFAPRIGLARIVEQTIAGTRTRVLVQFAPGAVR